MSRIAIIAAAALVTPAFADTTREPIEDIHGLGEVFFEFDSARVPAGTSDNLATAAEWSKAHPQDRLVLDGNADAVGSSTYNVGLALRRAESVQEKLIGLGVDPDRIVVVTYGEDGVRRTTASMDRRVTVWASNDPLYAIIDSSLVRGTAVIWRKPATTAEVDGPRAATVATK